MSYSSWADAFFVQAKQDFSLAYLGIKDETKYTASSYMLLQMFFEKYAKAVYCYSKKELPPRNHKTPQIFLSMLKRSPKYKVLLKKSTHSSGQRTYLDFFDFLSKLEDLQPSNANKGRTVDINPQLEYPWKNTTDHTYCAPCSDLDFIYEAKEPRSRIYIKVIPTAQALIEDFKYFLRNKCFP